MLHLQSVQHEILAIRASIFDLIEDPKHPKHPSAPQSSYRFFSDGLLLVNQGKILAIGDFATLQPTLAAETAIIDYRGKLLMPGMIDSHVHYPQTGIIASYGEQLLEWLNTYTFPEESKFSDESYAKEMANFFLEELFRCGTTTAMVWGTVHPQSVEALFTAAKAYGMRLITGKVAMDRNAPEYLLDSPQRFYDESKALLERWHGKERFHYALTPRFAPTSSPEQLELIGALYQEFPSVYLQTHLSENKQEVLWVKNLFPQHQTYLQVYDSYGLVGPRSVFGHGIHLEESEYRLLQEKQATIAFCPTSNGFLGSGLFPWEKAEAYAIGVSVASDVGGGTSFSMFRVLQEAYKVSLLQGRQRNALELFYSVTLGSARCLSLDQYIGNFALGKEADFIVVDLEVTPLQKLRQQRAASLEDKLFALLMLGDDRNIHATYISGQRVY